jgi:hypothetical protein
MTWNAPAQAGIHDSEPATLGWLYGFRQGGNDLTRMLIIQFMKVLPLK